MVGRISISISITHPHPSADRHDDVGQVVVHVGHFEAERDLSTVGSRHVLQDDVEGERGVVDVGFHVVQQAFEVQGGVLLEEGGGCLMVGRVSDVGVGGGWVGERSERSEPSEPTPKSGVMFSVSSEPTRWGGREWGLDRWACLTDSREAQWAGLAALAHQPARHQYVPNPCSRHDGRGSASRGLLWWRERGVH